MAALALTTEKTNLPELANGVTTDDDCTFGRTNNPWNLGCSPGGSSSGSCAAVAGGLVPLANANDGTGPCGSLQAHAGWLA